jgi:hypothetical protein
MIQPTFFSPFSMCYLFSHFVTASVSCASTDVGAFHSFFCVVLYSIQKYSCYTDLSSTDWLRAGRPRDRRSSSGRIKNVLFSMSSTPVLGSTQHPVQWVAGALSPGVKRPGREADHSPPASAEVKKVWLYTYTTPYTFIA